MSDPEGYDADPRQDALDRLVSDARTLGPSGIERVAETWTRTAGLDHERWLAAERAALAAVEATNRTARWDALRQGFHEQTEGRHAMVAWRAEHGPAGHHAESALLGALLGLLARDRLERPDFRTLVGPMAAALPWLLPGEEV